MQIRDVIGRLNFIGGKKREQSELRNLAAGTAKLARSGGLPDFLSGMAQLKQKLDHQMDGWLEAEDIEKNRAGAFDVCDLRAWIKLAEMADIHHVPAKDLIKVTHDELDCLLGPIRSQTDFMGKIKIAFSKAPDDMVRERMVQEIGQLVMPTEEVSQDRVSELREKMTSVMDEIPPSWMVRTNFSGSSNLKALVGTGLMLKGDDIAEIAPGLKLGAGWFQMGNRRTIDYADHRFVELSAMHKPVVTYLARPWAQPDRFHEGEDLHRANSPLAGRGKWPAEWRCFVKNGNVTGVANYYGWTGDGATAENAWNAVEAAAMAQELCDFVSRQGLYGEFADTIRARSSRHPQDQTALASWAEDKLHATLDFIETSDGLKFLEGGPGHVPGGGGHPCAFAGQSVDRSHPEKQLSACDGVAYRCMDHVNLGDPATWVDGPSEGAFASWEKACELAVNFRDLSPRAQEFLEKRGISLHASQHPSP